MSTVDDHAVDPRRVLQLRATKQNLIGSERNRVRCTVNLQRADEFIQISVRQFTLERALQLLQLHAGQYVSSLR